MKALNPRANVKTETMVPQKNLCSPAFGIKSKHVSRDE